MASPGSKLRYEVTIVNTGQVAYVGDTAATFSDDMTGVLDDATFDGQASASVGTTTYASPKLSWAGDLEPGQQAVITYEVLVGQPGAGDRLLVNAAVPDVPGGSCTGPSDADGGAATGRIEAAFVMASESAGPAPSATVQPSAEPSASPTPDDSEPARFDCAPLTTPMRALHISKTADRTFVDQRGTVTYTVIVSNEGGADYLDATFSDNLAGVLDDATFAGTATPADGVGDSRMKLCSRQSMDSRWHGRAGRGGHTDPDNRLGSDRLGRSCRQASRVAGGAGHTPPDTVTATILENGVTICSSHGRT